MCHVDLFPMPTDPAGAGGFRTANQPQPSGAPSAPSPMAASRPSGGASDRITPTGPSSSVRSTPYGAELIPGRRTTSSQHVDDPSDAVVAHVRGVPVLERSKRTVDLVGNTFSPCTCSKGKLIFAFTVRIIRRWADPGRVRRMLMAFAVRLPRIWLSGKRAFSSSVTVPSTRSTWPWAIRRCPFSPNASAGHSRSTPRTGSPASTPPQHSPRHVSYHSSNRPASPLEPRLQADTSHGLTGNHAQRGARHHPHDRPQAPAQLEQCRSTVRRRRRIRQWRPEGVPLDRTGTGAWLEHGDTGGVGRLSHCAGGVHD